MILNAPIQMALNSKEWLQNFLDGISFNFKMIELIIFFTLSLIRFSTEA